MDHVVGLTQSVTSTQVMPTCFTPALLNDFKVIYLSVRLDT